MKLTQYTGTFIRKDVHLATDKQWYKLHCHCNGFIQALFLLTASAIESGRHYQLDSIVSEDGTIVKVDDIFKVSSLLIRQPNTNTSFNKP